MTDKIIDWKVKCTVRDIQEDKDWTLVDVDYDVEAVKEHLGKDTPFLDDFDLFYVKIDHGEYTDILAMENTVPWLYKELYEPIYA